jgi:hypothetical protein
VLYKKSFDFLKLNIFKKEKEDLGHQRNVSFLASNNQLISGNWRRFPEVPPYQTLILSYPTPDRHFSPALPSLQIQETQMKIETLARRVAEKTRTPALEKIILGQGGVHDLPNSCIQWLGAASGKDGPRPRTRRGYDNLPYIGIAFDRRRPVVNFQKKSYHPARLLFEKLFDKPFPFRLHQQCATDMCVNPLHFELREICSSAYRPFPDMDMPPAVPPTSDDWSSEEVAELVEIALTENSPLNWAQLMELPIMEDAPSAQVAKYLATIGKPQLMPTE